MRRPEAMRRRVPGPRRAQGFCDLRALFSDRARPAGPQSKDTGLDVCLSAERVAERACGRTSDARPGRATPGLGAAWRRLDAGRREPPAVPAASVGGVTRVPKVVIFLPQRQYGAGRAVTLPCTDAQARRCAPPPSCLRPAGSA